MLWLTLVFLAQPASADEPSVNFGGSVQSDLRFRLFADQDATGPWYAPPDVPPDILRNQNTFNVNVKAKSGDYRGVVDLDFVLMGYPGEFGSLDDLSKRQVVEPHRIETRALYFEARDLFVNGLDLRVGHQIVQFGVGDQFNPTNTFNPNDVEDVLLFGDQMANMMVRADYAMGNWTATGVLIPVFKPSLIPSTGPLALTAIPRLPFYEDELRWRIHSESALGESLGYPTVIGDVIINTPEASLENMQFGFALGGFIGMQDLAFTYYNGFADIPGAVRTHTDQVTGEQCRNDNGTNCINGVLSNTVT
ncbi:MAG: hypothetical protein GWP91_15500, partial [Rhodobacterales bacterium]|nr:hypothetical protein [Rhodobacterales bacterium]